PCEPHYVPPSDAENLVQPRTLRSLRPPVWARDGAGRSKSLPNLAFQPVVPRLSRLRADAYDVGPDGRGESVMTERPVRCHQASFAAVTMSLTARWGSPESEPNQLRGVQTGGRHEQKSGGSREGIQRRLGPARSRRHRGHAH